jgi:hypothetical protein
VGTVENELVETQRERARLLFFERWLEQLETSFTPRRARTLGAISALDELVALAEGFVRSGGQQRPAVDPEDAGHGVRMLPDVAKEAGEVLAGDEILTNEYPTRKSVLLELVHRLESKENATPELIEQIKALLGLIRDQYLTAGFRALRSLTEGKPKRQASLTSIADSLVSELRNRGWSDDGLRDAIKTANPGADRSRALEDLERLISTPATEFECYVSVSLPQRLAAMKTDQPSFSFVDVLPDVARHGRAMKTGTYLRARVRAHDPAAAAAIAHQRSVATLGALKVFLPGSQGDVSSEVVGVLDAAGLKSYEVQEKLLEEHRFTDDKEAVQVLRSSWRAHESRAGDPLHDAIRLRHRALVASDPESRLLLLWSGMERMTAGARGVRFRAGSGARAVPHAVCFGKLRRDIRDLVSQVVRHIAFDDEKRKALLLLVGAKFGKTVRIERVRFLEYLMGTEEKLRELTVLFYGTSPLLAFRCHELWRALGAGKADSRGGHLADYHERSRERVARQICRIYRARNRIAHVGASPDRVRDLVWHAHFYLTQLTAICVHYGEREDTPAQDILVRRLGQYKAFMKLLKANDASTLTAQCLLRPSMAVGEPQHPSIV